MKYLLTFWNTETQVHQCIVEPIVEGWFRYWPAKGGKATLPSYYTMGIGPLGIENLAQYMAARNGISFFSIKELA